MATASVMVAASHNDMLALEEINQNESDKTSEFILESREGFRLVDTSCGMINDRLLNNSLQRTEERQTLFRMDDHGPPCERISSDRIPAIQNQHSSFLLHAGERAVIHDYPQPSLHPASQHKERNVHLLASHSQSEFAAATEIGNGGYPRNEQGSEHRVPNELGYRSDHGAYRPVSHVLITNPHSLVNGSRPVCPIPTGLSSVKETSPYHSQLLDSSARVMSDPTRDIPRDISIGSGHGQRLSYRSEHGLHHHPSASGRNMGHHSIDSSSYGIPNFPGNGERHRSDPTRGVPRSWSYEPSPHDNLDSNRNVGGSRRLSAQYHHAQQPDPLRGVSRSRSCEPSPYSDPQYSTGYQPDPLRDASRSTRYEPIPYDRHDSNHKSRRSSRRSDARDSHCRESNPLRSVSRSISHEPSPHDYPQSDPAKQPSPSRGVSRSKSYESSPYSQVDGGVRPERCSRRSDAQNIPADRQHPLRGVPRSISLKACADNGSLLLSNGGSEHVLGYSNNSSRYSDPRGKSLAHNQHGSGEYSRNKQDRIEKNGDGPSSRNTSRDHCLTRSFRSSTKSDHQRLLEVSESLHSMDLGSTSSSEDYLDDEEFAMEHVDKNEKPRSEKKKQDNFSRSKKGNSMRGSFKKESKSRTTKLEEKEESAKDGALEAYKAMANATDRARKKKLNETSYVKVTLGNGLSGYVKAI